MSKLKRDLKNDTIPNKTTRGAEITTACTANASIGTVTPELTAFSTANGALTTTASQLAAAQAAVTALVNLQAANEKTWDATFESLLVKIEGNTNGDKLKMGTTTVATYDPGVSTPTPAVVQVLSLSVTNGDMPHELDLSWNAQRPRPQIYMVRMCMGTYDQSKMVQIGTPTASQFTATNLTPGQVYWFEVCAVGTGNHQGPWSDPAMGTAI